LGYLHLGTLHNPYIYIIHRHMCMHVNQHEVKTKFAHPEAAPHAALV
jgi:hypothetical protein